MSDLQGLAPAELNNTAKLVRWSVIDLRRYECSSLDPCFFDFDSKHCQLSPSSVLNPTQDSFFSNSFKSPHVSIFNSNECD